MSSVPPINKLSTELVIKIFESLDNLTDVVHLARTSQAFHAIWQRHTPTICATVLPSTVPYYSQAEHLADVIIQRRHDRFLASGIPCQAESIESAIKKPRLILYLSRTARKEFENAYDKNTWGEQWTDRVDFLLLMSKSDYNISERRCPKPFLKYYYQLWELTIMPFVSAWAILEPMEASEKGRLLTFSDMILCKVRYSGTRTPSTDQEYWSILLASFYGAFAEHYDEAFLHHLKTLTTPPLITWTPILRRHRSNRRAS